MKTLKIKDFEGKELDIVLNITRYASDNSLAIQMKYFDEDDNVLPYAMLTVHFSDVTYVKNCAFVDVNNLGDSIVTWIIENNLGRPTGRYHQCGYVNNYPEIEFNMDEVKKYTRHFIEIDNDGDAREVSLIKEEALLPEDVFDTGNNISRDALTDLKAIAEKFDFEHNAAITLDVWGTPDSVPKAVLDFIVNEMPISFIAKLLSESEAYVVNILRTHRDKLYDNVAAAYMETPCDEFCKDFLPELRLAMGKYHKKKDTVKVKAVWEFEFNKSCLDDRIVDVEDAAIDAATARLATLFLENQISSRDFKFVVEKDDNDVM